MLMKTRSILTRFGLILAGFMITAAASAATTDDHGNSPSTATAVTAPATIAGNLETAGDVDYFKITLTTPAVITATSSGTTDVVGTLLLPHARADTHLLLACSVCPPQQGLDVCGGHLL